MAISVSKSGGIYVEIAGDYSTLKKDLHEVERMGAASGKAISQSFTSSSATGVKTASKNYSDFALQLRDTSKQAQASVVSLSQTQNSVLQAANAISRKNTVAATSIATILKQTAALGSQSSSYNKLAEAAKAAAQSELKASQARVTSLTSRLAEIEQNIRVKQSTLAELESGTTEYGTRSQAYQRTRAAYQKQINDLQKQQVQISGQLVTANQSLDTSMIKAAGTAKLQTGAFATLKVGASGLLQMLGGPLGVAIVGATAAIGYLSKAESGAEKTAKSYGKTLDEVKKYYDDIISGANQAAQATLQASSVFRAAQLAMANDILQGVDKAKTAIDDLTSYATGSTFDPWGAGEIKNIYGVAQEYKDALASINDEFKNLAISPQEAIIKIGELQKAAEKAGSSKSFIRVLQEISTHLVYVAENADTARGKIEDLQKTEGWNLEFLNVKQAKEFEKSLADLEFQMAQVGRTAAEQDFFSFLNGKGLDTSKINIEGGFVSVKDIELSKEQLNLLQSMYEKRVELAQMKSSPVFDNAAEAAKAERARQKAAEEAARQAEKDLAVQKDFWKEYRELTVSGYGDWLDIQTEAIGKQRDIFEKAGVSLEDAQRWQIEKLKDIAAKNPVLIEMELAQKRLDRGESNFSDGLNVALGSIVEDYQNAAVSLTNAWGDFFSSFTQGFADSVGQAIVYSDDLGDALNDVARSAVSNLISALVQLGVQYAVNAALGQSIAAASDTAAVAQAQATGTAIAEAYSAAATMASLASYGANSVPAIAGMTATYATAKGLAAFKAGGYTGAGAPDEIKGVVHAGEYVIPAPAVSQIGLPALEAISGGRSMDPKVFESLPAAWADRPQQTQLKISVENYGTSKDFEVQQLSPDEVRLIVRDVMDRELDPRMSSLVDRPNSRTSKSMGRNISAPRRRN